MGTIVQFSKKHPSTEAKILAKFARIFFTDAVSIMIRDESDFIIIELHTVDTWVEREINRGAFPDREDILERFVFNLFRGGVVSLADVMFVRKKKPLKFQGLF